MSSEDVIVSDPDIEKPLNIPKDDKGAAAAAVERLKNSLLSLDFVKAALASSDPFDLLTPNDQAFIGCSKIITLLFAAGVNSLNFFGTTQAFGSGHDRVDRHPWMKTVFLCFTILSMPFTVATAGVAHATEFVTAWINRLAYMVFLECALMATLSGLYAFYLTDVKLQVAIPTPISICLVVWVFLVWMFKRPSLIGTPGRRKKDEPASEYLKKVMKDNNINAQDLARLFNETKSP